MRKGWVVIRRPGHTMTDSPRARPPARQRRLRLPVPVILKWHSRHTKPNCGGRLSPSRRNETPAAGDLEGLVRQVMHIPMLPRAETPAVKAECDSSTRVEVAVNQAAHIGYR